jgi:hypothetical protein
VAAVADDGDERLIGAAEFNPDTVDGEAATAVTVL